MGDAVQHEGAHSRDLASQHAAMLLVQADVLCSLHPRACTGSSAEAQALEDMTLEQEKQAFADKKQAKAAAAAEAEAGAATAKQAAPWKAWSLTLDQMLVAGVAVAVFVAMVFVSRLQEPPASVRSRVCLWPWLGQVEGRQSLSEPIAMGVVFGVLWYQRTLGLD